MAEETTVIDRYPSAGGWLGLADRAEALADDLTGTDLAYWTVVLRSLVGDCQGEAGAEAAHEVDCDGGHGHLEPRPR